MDWLKTFVNDFVEIMKNWGLWLLQLLVDVISTAVSFIIDGGLAVVHSLLMSLDLGSYALSYAAHWVNLPSQLIYLLNACYIPQALTMLAGAYTIRFTLNLIPSVFTRV